MVKYYRGQFFFPFSLDQGTFKGLCADKPVTESKPGEWFVKASPIEPTKTETFAEYQYFHPHARSLLFSRYGDGGRDQPPSLLVYEVGQDKLDGWTIEVSWPAKIPPRDSWTSKSVRLNLEWVMACIYDLDVGCLVFGVNCRPDKQDGGVTLPPMTFGDVLDVNNLLRRSSPSFLDMKKVGQSRTDLKVSGWGSYQAERAGLPTAIRIIDGKGVEQGIEDYGDRFDKYLAGGRAEGDEGIEARSPYIGYHYGFWTDKLLKDLNIGIEKQEGCAIALPAHSSQSLKPILDERNFLCSLVVADKSDTGFGEQPSQSAVSLPSHLNQYGLLENESSRFRQTLYQYAFIDPSTSCFSPNAQFRDLCLQESLYLRFRDFGSYYAFTRYSGVYLMHGDYDEFKQDFSGHFNSMYFQMASLALCSRAILLALSERASAIAHRVSSSTADFDNHHDHQDLQELRADFLKFQNKYWFSEVTGQEMGIEIFNLWSRNMGNEKLFNEVEKEIQALHDFSNATVGRRLGVLTYLNLAMLPLAIIGVITGVLGMSVFQGVGWCANWWWGVGALLIGALLSAGFILKGSWLVDRIQGMVSFGITKLVCCRNKRSC